MDRSTVITLISENYTQDSIGQYVYTESEREVFCDVRSITRVEWFEAGRNGFQPVYIFTMFEPDYEGEKIVEYDDKRYGIYRTYRGRNETIELYVEEKGGLGGIEVTPASTASTASTASSASTGGTG